MKRLIRIVPVFGCLCLTPAMLFRADAELIHKTESYELELRGERSSLFEYRDLSGKLDGFSAGFRRLEETALELSGQWANQTRIHGVLQDHAAGEPFEESELRIWHPRWGFRIGQFQTGLSRAGLLLESRTIAGGEAEISNRHWVVSGIISEGRGKPHYERFPYEGSGEYRLGHLPVVVSSEKIRLGDKILIRNRDYHIDYLTGRITLSTNFLAHALEAQVGEDMFVRVTYESQSDLQGRMGGGTVALRADSMREVSFSVVGEEESPGSESPEKNVWLGSKAVWSVGNWFHSDVEIAGQPVEGHPFEESPWAIRGKGKAEKKAFSAVGEAEHRKAGYTPLGTSHALPGRANFVAGKGEFRPVSRYGASGAFRQESFEFSPNIQGSERELSGDLRLSPWSRLRGSIFGRTRTASSLSDPTRADTLRTAGSRWTGSRDSWSLTAGSRWRSERLADQTRNSIPIEMILNTQAYDWLRTMTGFRYERPLEGPLSASLYRLNYTASAHHALLRALGSGAVDWGREGSPAFQTSLNLGSEIGEFELKGDLQQRFWEEQGPARDEDSASALSSENMPRKTAWHRGRADLRSNYGIRIGFSPAIQYKRINGETTLRDIVADLETGGTVSGLFRPGMGLTARRYQQYDESQFVPSLHDARESQELRLEVTSNRIASTVFRLSWMGNTHAEEQYQAMVRTHKQQGTGQQYAFAADAAFSEFWALLSEARFEVENQNLEEGPSRDPFVDPTRRPKDQIWRALDSRTYEIKESLTWTNGSMWEAEAGLAYGRRYDYRNADGSLASETVTETWKPSGGCILRYGVLSAGVDLLGGISSGRYNTRKYRAEPHFRFDFPELHLMIEGRGSYERSYLPDYLTREAFLEMRVSF